MDCHHGRNGVSAPRLKRKGPNGAGQLFGGMTAMMKGTTMSKGAYINDEGVLVIDMAKADKLWNSMNQEQQFNAMCAMFDPLLAKAKEQAARIEALTAERDALAEKLALIEKVEPLDLSTVLMHAFLSGVVAARNIPAFEPINGPRLWAAYEPYKPGPYTRIHATLAAIKEGGE